MPPLSSRLDPEGYYDRLGLQPAAAAAAIVAAYRSKARLLHPDVPVTGNAAAFLAMKQAYDVLSNQDRRAAYDRSARQAAAPPEPVVIRQAEWPSPPPTRHPRFSDLPIPVWAGVAALLLLGIYQVTSHLLTPSTVVRAEIRPNAAVVAPLSDSAHQAVLYGPAPVRLAGTPNFYVVPAGSAAMLWRADPARDNALTPIGQLPPFSSVQAVRLIRQTGMLEVLVTDTSNGFIGADHLVPGTVMAARAAYCGYNAGPIPFDGEVLEHHASGPGSLNVENRAVQPAVVKLRDMAGTVVVSVFLGPNGHVTLTGLPEGSFRPDFAIGELWSRACNTFAAGMRARRADATMRVPAGSVLIVAPDANLPAATDIPDQTFGQQ